MSNFSGIKKFWSHKVDDEDITEGDHLYVWGKGNLYTHHGIFVNKEGDLLVNVLPAKTTDDDGIKIDRPIKLKGCTKKGCGRGKRGQTSVFSICLDCFKNGRHVRRYRYGVSGIEHMLKFPGTCTMATSLVDKEVYERAETITYGTNGEYNIAANNCEDFALRCKTGFRVKKDRRGTSSQANGLRSLLLASVAGAGALALTYKYNLHGNRLCRLSSTTLAASALTFVTARHFYDIGVRNDSIEESMDDIVKRFMPKIPAAGVSLLRPDKFKKSAIETALWDANTEAVVIVDDGKPTNK